MTTTPQDHPASSQGTSTPRGTARADAARDHLWMHFTRHSTYEQGGAVPIIVRGEGHTIWDAEGRDYIDGLSGLFTVQVGHGRTELAQAAAKHTTTAITAILSNDENFVDSSDTVYILPFIFNIFEECLA